MGPYWRGEWDGTIKKFLKDNKYDHLSKKATHTLELFAKLGLSK